MFIALNYKTKKRLMILFIIIGFVISTIITAIIYKNKHPNDYKIMITKIETVDKNSIEFFIGDNALNKTYNKIKNKKFNEIDLVDEQKINNILKYYNKFEYNYEYICVDDTKIEISNFLKSDNANIKKYLPRIDNSATKYYAIFYKIVIDKDMSYANYLDKNINEKLIKQAMANKQITTTRLKNLPDISFIIMTLTAVIVMLEIRILDTIEHAKQKYNDKAFGKF